MASKKKPVEAEVVGADTSIVEINSGTPAVVFFCFGPRGQHLKLQALERYFRTLLNCGRYD